MTAMRPSPALNDAVIAQLHKDRLEELTWNPLPFRNLRGLRPFVDARALGKHGGRANRVLRFAGQHLTLVPWRLRPVNP